jgi:DNA-binding SARP family transcriptional activator
MALLAYLAIAPQKHSREELVALLWPEYDPRQGRADLSRMLSALRKVLGADYFVADRQTVGLNGQADLWVDVLQFLSLVGACRGKVPDRLNDDCLQNLDAAADLYRADFLTGFTMDAGPAFDEWQLLQSESLRHEFGWVLEVLTTAYETRNDFHRAIASAQQWLRLDPLHEEAHRRLMTLYAANGQLAAARRQYKTMADLLAEELGVEPQAESQQLFDQLARIAQEQVSLSKILADMPEKVPDQRAGQERFVGREQELALLADHLQAALAGDGRVIFVTGGAGRGKTSLLEEFSRRAQEGQPDLIVAGGACNAYAGVGDPYLPFREALGLLTGDVQTRLAAGAILPDQARRLWRLLPRAMELLLEVGPHLLDVFVAGKALLARAETAGSDAAVIEQLQEMVESQRASGYEQSGLFSEFTNLLRRLSKEQPLLINLDDLQWIDETSLGLLFHLGRRLSGSRMLIIGAYRPDELIHGRDGRLHPLQNVLGEFQTQFGNTLVDLTAADQRGGRAFVEALLDSEPNRLGESFRRALLRQTGGHPLFTVQLLRELQSSGSLAEDEKGRWIETGAIDWDVMPKRVEAVIAQRIGRLDDSLQHILRIASIEGDRFSIEIVAQAAGLDKRELVERFSRELVKQHSLLTAQGVERLQDAGTLLSYYRFRHHLFQIYLYQSLDEVERVYLHEAVGNALETLYGEQVDEIAAQLARHFGAAGQTTKAITYLWRAGERALRLSAYDEAIDSLRRGLALCSSLPQTPENVQRKLDLLLSLGDATRKAGQFEVSQATFQQAADIARSEQLPEMMGRAAIGYEESRWRFNLPAAPSASLLKEALDVLDEATSLPAETPIHVRLWVNLVRARMDTSSPEQFAQMTRQALDMARRINDPTAIYDALYLIVRGDRRPERSAERLRMLDEMRHLSETEGDRENIYDTYGFRLQEFLEIGDRVSFEKEYNLFGPLAARLKQPFYAYYPALARTLLTLCDGRFAESEKAAQNTLEIGRQMRVENVDGVYSMQIFTIRREQGRLKELAPFMRVLAQQSVAAAWQPGLALLYNDLDMRAEAEAIFEDLAADDFTGLPQDAMWVTSISFLAEVCVYLDDAERAAVLYDYLLPYKDRTIMVGFLCACYGAAARYLGILATTLQRWVEAEAHFEDALEMNTRIGARPWLAHTKQQYAAMLLARGKAADHHKAKQLLHEALATAEELGMQALKEKVKNALAG